MTELSDYKRLVEKPQLERLSAEIAALTIENRKLDAALRQKDEAMGVLFDRLRKAGVDCSDLIP